LSLNLSRIILLGLVGYEKQTFLKTINGEDVLLSQLSIPRSLSLGPNEDIVDALFDRIDDERDIKAASPCVSTSFL
jgi:hypothetical protein